MRIRTRLVLLLAAALVGTTGLATWLSLGLTRRMLEDDARARAAEVAGDVSEALEKLAPDADEDDVGYELEVNLRRHRSLVQVEFSDPGGPNRVPADYVLWYDQPATEIRRPRAPVRPRAREPQIQDDTLRGLRVIGVTVPVRGRRPPGDGRLVLRLSLEFIDRHVAALSEVSLGVTFAAVLVLALLAAGISERVVGRRLRSLATAMRGVERGNLAIRVEGEAAGGDEVSELARGFNNMIARVGEADAAIRAFNQRLADEVQKATRDLADKNDALVETNRLLIAARRELGDKERLAALGQLAAQLAHEVGTPLSSVSGHLQLALARGDAPAALQERLEIAHREVERVSRIIRDYLDSTRPVAPEMERVATEQLLREAVEIALGPPGPAAAPGGRVDVETEIAPDAALLWTDAALVRQIVVNLVTNARDAVEAAPARGDRAGRVRVRAYRAPAQVGEGGVSIEVRDAGHGISPAELERIFEPFYTTKGRGKGTGLGLAICRELARTVGGRIEVESGAGVGSAFTLVLPAREAGAVAAAPGAVAQGAA